MGRWRATDADFARYLDARWADLVGGLEDEGVPADDARLAVAETLLASRRSWSRRVRDEQVDVSLWAEMRERAGLPARPGEAVPHGVRRLDPRDAPEEWLARARRSAGARADAALPVAGSAGWRWPRCSRPGGCGGLRGPPPPEVREEANPLPVIWYAQGELHLEEVVVELPDGRRVRGVGLGRRGAPPRRARWCGSTPTATCTTSTTRPTRSTRRRTAPPFLALGQYDVLVQSAPVPGGGWAHLLDSSRRRGVATRCASPRRAGARSSSAPRTTRCSAPRTIIEADGSIRLR